MGTIHGALRQNLVCISRKRIHCKEFVSRKSGIHGLQTHVTRTKGKHILAEDVAPLLHGSPWRKNSSQIELRRGNFARASSVGEKVAAVLPTFLPSRLCSLLLHAKLSSTVRRIFQIEAHGPLHGSQVQGTATYCGRQDKRRSANESVSSLLERLRRGDRRRISDSSDASASVRRIQSERTR